MTFQFLPLDFNPPGNFDRVNEKFFFFNRTLENDPPQMIQGHKNVISIFSLFHDTLAQFQTVFYYLNLSHLIYKVLDPYDNDYLIQNPHNIKKTHLALIEKKLLLCRNILLKNQAKLKKIQSL